MNKNKIIIFSWTAVFLWLVLIFYLSSQPAVQSDGLSKKVTKVIIENVGKVVPLAGETSTTTDLVEHFNHLVRKYAHFTLYFVLGILVMNGFRQSGVIGWRGFLFSLVFCMLYAASDEVHQVFVPGRGAQITDVFIDSFGAFVGIWIYDKGRFFFMHSTS
ncbi:phosphotransbutyrylase [Crassaminicella thermophila]|uniref:Phosphotransbutyrylase n=1 Tax=Crassaminicella thermophila TaxID=2599308 RepID=A0A5C0SHC2_CRATE|nr:VanZ family protein [Crassaminicella thermophila]QEK13382.1 phosphotransbutyrylase [Crassaminicella thermophila]